MIWSRQEEIKMLAELDTYTSSSKQYDFCIIGTGPAGITMATRLAEKGNRILLLEAGGLDYSEQSQENYECESVGHEGWPKYTRLRFFGGTSNHWSGRCRPFEASDFDRETINNLPGWPIRYSELEPYLNEAMKIIDLDIERGFQPKNEDILEPHLYPDRSAQSPPTRFKAKYLDRIKNNPNIDCFYNASATDMTLNSAYQAVQTVTVSDYNYREKIFSANKFILCLGGIENPRFLLNCNKQVANGLGNSGDMVGRCFMEHLNVPLGGFVYRDPESFSGMQFFTNPDFCESQDIGTSNVTLGIIQKIRSYGRTHAIKTFFKNLACDMNIEEKVQFISEFKCPGMGNISTLMEQSPNLNSRVMLGSKVDKFGLRQTKFDWQINEYDKNTIRTIGKELAREFSAEGLGNVRLNDFVLDNSGDTAFQFSRHCHHMGTTRMSKDPKYGVVDTNAKVHDLDNLYIAGSSVFSTGGACNPTMPILQLCLRLVDHLTA